MDESTKSPGPSPSHAGPAGAAEGRAPRRAHVVLAHPEPASFNGQLASAARRELRRQGWRVTLTDLYAAGFDPREGAAHYPRLRDPDRLDVMAQQRFASEHDAVPAEVQRELERLDEAELVILQYPMWWHLPPAILKGWFDRVFLYGAVYSSRQRFEHGRFAGKRVLLSVTVATSADTYAFNGRSADIDLLLWPVHFTLAYVGFGVLAPFISYDVRPATRGGGGPWLDSRLAELTARLRRLGDEALIPFHRMSDWGADGRIKPDVPVWSPFIRHRERLDLGGGQPQSAGSGGDMRAPS